MIELIGSVYNFQALPVQKLWEKDDDQILAYGRGDLVFVFNFNPSKSFSDYGVLTPPGKYKVVLSSDDPDFGGYGNIDTKVEHLTLNDPLYSPHGVEWLKLYLPVRSAMVLRRVRERKPRAKAATGAASRTAPKSATKPRGKTGKKA